MSALRVLAPGFRSTIQDRGRFGHLRDAVPPAGPADPIAFEAAQRLVGNTAADAAIEVVGLPFAFTLDEPRLIAATGRGVRIRTRGAIDGWTSVFARAGEEVEIEGDESARLAYVAASGGVELEPVLGSRATYLPSGIGPLPRALVTGDALPLGPARRGAERAGRHAAPAPRERIAVVAGPHAGRFGGLAAFAGGGYRVSARSDRMGVRLEGPPLVGTGGEILSVGVLAGAVQVPYGGEPIVLLADHQTTGGYPVIAVVAAADLGAVASASAGEALSFYQVDRRRALEDLRAVRRWLDAID